VEKLEVAILAAIQSTLSSGGFPSPPRLQRLEGEGLVHQRPRYRRGKNIRVEWLSDKLFKVDIMVPFASS